ncbi:hypothetical protein LXL04_031150 [Taraxacum kok-saghyz]
MYKRLTYNNGYHNVDCKYFGIAQLSQAVTPWANAGFRGLTNNQACLAQPATKYQSPIFVERWRLVSWFLGLKMFLIKPYLNTITYNTTTNNNRISRTTISPAWFWEPVSSATSILLVIGLLLCSIAFVVAAILKARSIKKGNASRAWKLTTFQHLDFTCDDVLDSLKEENIIGKGGVGIVYKGVMPNNEHVEVRP